MPGASGIDVYKRQHVKSATPTLEMASVMLTGNYYGYIQLMGLTREEMVRQNMKMVEGSALPEENSSTLELVIGNGALTMFYDKTSDKGYWDTQEVPDIDFKNDSLFLILDQDAYFNSTNNSESPDTEEGNQTPAKPPKKHVVKARDVYKRQVHAYGQCDCNAAYGRDDGRN